MANTANLRGYLSDLANSIRHVSGINTNIPANEYDLIINNFILSNETNLEITPSTIAQNFGAPAGYSGYNSINVAAVTNSIDSNITPANLVNGVNILGVVGTFSGDANVVSSDIISGKIAYGNGQQIVGTMNNVGDINITPNIASQLLDAGFYNSINVAPVTANIDENITASNIKKNVTILGVTGILEFEDPTPLFASIEDMEAAIEDYPENTMCIVYSDDYLGTYQKQSGEWVLLSVETDGYKTMNILNLVDLIPDDYDGYGGTEQEIMAVLNQIA